MNLSKIRSAARSQQLLHVFRAYFAPILCISLVINSRQTYVLSHLSLTDCILATKGNTEVFKVLRSVTKTYVTTNAVARWSRCKFYGKTCQRTALYVQMTCRCCSDMINKPRNISFLTRLSLSARHLTTNGKRWSNTMDWSLFLSSWHSMAMCGSWAMSSARTGASVMHHHSYWSTGQY